MLQVKEMQKLKRNVFARLLLIQKVCFVFGLCEYVRCGVTHVCQASYKRGNKYHSARRQGSEHLFISFGLLIPSEEEELGFQSSALNYKRNTVD